MPSVILAPSATPIDWTIIAGCDTFTIVVPVLDATGAAVNVTGWTVKAQVRRSSADPLLHEWSTTNGNAACSGTNVTLSVIAAVTETWAFTDAQMSIVVTDTESVPHCIAYGNIHVIPDITQIP